LLLFGVSKKKRCGQLQTGCDVQAEGDEKSAKGGTTGGKESNMPLNPVRCCLIACSVLLLSALWIALHLTVHGAAR
jgi:hypothetical protein